MVISCSWGWYPWVYLDNIAKIIDTAANYGIPVIFSSGNDGTYGDIGYTIGFPASLPTTIGVGAIRKTGEHWLYSGSGPGIDVVAPSGAVGFSMDVGDVYTLDQMDELGYNPYYVSCLTTNENYLCTFGGTSGACPQVAGILALIRLRQPDIESYDTLKMILDSSAIDGIGDQYDSLGWDGAYGFGLASAFRALLSVSHGDVNNDAIINVFDVTYLINYSYLGGPPPAPDKLMADANCDGIVNIFDTTFLLAWLYKGGPPPPMPCFEYGD